MNPARRLAPTAAAVVLFVLAGWLAFAPAGWWPCAWLTLTGLLWLVTRVRGWRLALVAWGAGMVLYTAHLHWLRYVTLPGWFALAFYHSLYVLVLALVLGWAWRRGARLMMIPITGTTVMVLEFVQGHLMTGFGWFLLAYSQFRVPVLIQGADLGGPYLVSGGIAACSAALFVTLHRLLTPPRPDTRRRWITPAVITLAIPVAMVGYGLVRLHQVQTVEGPRLGCVQGNVHFGLDTLMHKDFEDRLDDLRLYLDLAQRVGRMNPDIVLLPESSAPLMEVEYAEGRPAEPYAEARARLCREAIAAEVRRQGRPFIVNALRYRLSPPPEDPSVSELVNQYNTVYVFDRRGQITDRYDKIHRVPFGEYVPLTGVFPFLYKLTPFRRPEDGILPGTEQNLLEVPWQDGSLQVGALVCFEDTHPYLARGLKRRGAEVLVNLTNGAWFGPTSALTQHLGVATFRSVETRLPMVRCTQSGVSAMVSPTGRVEVLSVDGRSEGVQGVAVFGSMLPAPESTGPTVYTRFGDVPTLGALVLLSGCVIVLWKRGCDVVSRKADAP